MLRTVYEQSRNVIPGLIKEYINRDSSAEHEPLLYWGNKVFCRLDEECFALFHDCDMMISNPNYHELLRSYDNPISFAEYLIQLGQSVFVCIRQRGQDALVYNVIVDNECISVCEDERFLNAILVIQAKWRRYLLKRHTWIDDFLYMLSDSFGDICVGVLDN
jgi:hypothetical protein